MSEVPLYRGLLAAANKECYGREGKLRALTRAVEEEAHRILDQVPPANIGYRGTSLIRNRILDQVMRLTACWIRSFSPTSVTVSVGKILQGYLAHKKQRPPKTLQ